MTFWRFGHGRPAFPAVLPQPRSASTTPLRSDSCHRHRRTTFAGGCPTFRLRLRDSSESRRSIPRQHSTKTDAPLFASPPRGRPAGSVGEEGGTRPDRPAVADCRLLALNRERPFRTRVAGLFLFLPVLAQLGFDQLVHQAGYLGSRMIKPAT